MNDKKQAQLDAIRHYDSLIRRQAGHAVRPYRADGYVNLMTKYGTSKDSSERYQYEAEPQIPDDLLTEYYESNGLFAKIIDTPADEAIKHGFKLKDLKDTKIEDFCNGALDELGWEDTAATAIKWTRLFGGAIVVLLINDGRGIDEPLDWEHIQSIDDIRVYDRSLIQPDYSNMFFHSFDDPFNTRGSRLGMPEYYDIYSKYGNFRVHDSRCLVFQNGILPENTTNSVYQIWGVPEYIRLKRAIRDAEIAHGSAVKLLDRSIQAVYKMKDLSNELATDEGEDRVLKRLQTIDMARGLLNSMVIDAEGEDYDFKTFQFTGISDVVDSACNYLSALTSIPQTILFGRSPAGMNSTGESDLENYYNYVQGIQNRMLKKNIRYLLSVVLQAGLATGEIDEVPDIDIEFNPLWSMSEQEQANIEQQKAATQQTRAQTAQIYVDMEAIDPSEVRKKLADSEEFDVESMLDEYDEEDLFENDPSNKLQDMTPGMEQMGETMQDTAPQAGQTAVGPQENTESQQPIGEKTSTEEHEKDVSHNSPTAAPAATKLPQDMSEEEKKAAAKAQNADSKDEINLHDEIGTGVIVVKDGKILTGIRCAGKGFGQICGPGGHCEAGEFPWNAALRETEEEFGIRPKDLHYLGIVKGSYEGDLASAVYLCTDYDGEVECDDHEMSDPAFRPIEAIECFRNVLFSPFRKSLDLLSEALSDTNFDAEVEWTTVNGTHVPLHEGKATGGGKLAGRDFSKATSEKHEKKGKSGGVVSNTPNKAESVSASKATETHKKPEPGGYEAEHTNDPQPAKPSAQESASVSLQKPYGEGYSDTWTDPSDPSYTVDLTESKDYWLEGNKDQLVKNWKARKAQGINESPKDFEEHEYTAWQMSKVAGHEKQMSLDKALDIMNDSMPENVFHGWFVEANSGYKPRVVEAVTKTPEARSAALSLMYENYKYFHPNNKMTFQEFLYSPMTMYRGGHGQKHTEDDIFSAYSWDKKVAEGFAGKDGKVYEAHIRPIDTYGSVNDTGESEIMVPTAIAPNGNVDSREDSADVLPPAYLAALFGINGNDYSEKIFLDFKPEISTIKSQETLPDDIIEDVDEEDWVCTNPSAKEDGGPGSGNRNHKGVKGQFGGSAPNGGKRAKGSWSDDFPKACAQTTGRKVVDHPDHEAAKHGDLKAAERLVNDLTKPSKVKQLADAYPEAIVVPVSSKGDGTNQIPKAYAKKISESGLDYDDGITITKKANRTATSQKHRLFSNNEIAGNVQKGREYIVADDIVTSGASLNEYRLYIESKGGKVVATTTLGIGGKGSTEIKPKKENIEKAVKRHGAERLAKLCKKIGKEDGIESLTNWQVNYIAQCKPETLDKMMEE